MERDGMIGIGMKVRAAQVWVKVRARRKLGIPPVSRAGPGLGAVQGKGGVKLGGGR